ncbi:MAG: AbrB/MazE/SpoVT family DNA-binding domain-containing protein [Spirochaetales bacterium]|nr:AbrB/MazE/SpoVT family DNA-binding domain-containing protein [Spirochaetales bacterium]
MKASVVRIGNSRGLRLPARLLELYGLSEGDELVLEERAEGILVRPAPRADGKLDREEAYRRMAEEVAERAEWSDWDGTAGDGLER